MKGKKMEPTTDENEDWCFYCKDGGELILCDHKGCVKAYHVKCLEENDISLKNVESLICGRHNCFICKKPTKFYCFCCPNGICGHCHTVDKFVRVKKDRGFCHVCLEIILLIEEHRDCDSDGANVDFEDQDTCEGLFKGYWDIIKEEEGLTLETVYSADIRLKKGKNYKSKQSKSDRDRKDNEDTDADASLSESDENDMAKRSTGRKKKRSAVQKKNSGGVKFEGWGSKPLISFLISIGQDTTKELSCCDVDSIISRYINQNNLFEPGRKRKVVCDDKLFSIFRKKKINKHRLYSLLEPHFLENVEELSEEEEKEVEKGSKDLGISKQQIRSLGYKRKKMGKSNKKEAVCRMPKEKKMPEVQENLSAAIIAPNIKLIYLRRSLVEELIKQSTAEDKILGSFVKVKTDPLYSQQRCSHQLLKVTGIIQPSAEGISTEVLLEVSNIPQAVTLSLLSDAELSEEDCEDLRQRVENGLMQKPTVTSLLQKAKLLHVDITKHWIERELVRLQNLIDQANEKGRRRELDQYLQQRTLLKKPAEQERLLKQQPKVFPESLQTKLPPPASPSSSGSYSSDNDSASEGSHPSIIEVD